MVSTGAFLILFMNKKCVITGDSRGLGLAFKQHFQDKGWQVIGFNRQTGFDNVVNQSVGCDLFINNAYADGIQLSFLNQLYSSVNKMIVCGSVAAFNPDPKLPVYSNNKKILAERVRDLSNPNILMLHLSAKGYNDVPLVLSIVDLWLENSNISEVMFDPTGNPNE